MTVRSAVRSLVTVATVATAAVALAGCATVTTPLPSPSATSTSSTTAPATVPPSSSPAPASAAPSSTAPSSGVHASSPSSAGSSAADRSGACSFDHLSVSIAGQDGEPLGAEDGMNHREVSVVLRNTGSSPCTVQGWPGVSYVGHGNGTQVGGSATLVRDVPHPTVTLRPGGSAQAHLSVVSAGSLADPDACTPTAVDGMRIYPPGSKRSFFVRTVVTTTDGVCGEASISMMSVEAFVPNS